MASNPGINNRDVLLAVTTISFDIAALELFLPLTVGAHVVIASRETGADGHALLEQLTTSEATIVQATPSTWRMLLEAGFASHPGLKLLAGGEALTRELADRLLAGGGRLWNMYGPTETTIWSSCREILADDATITIGRPIRNTQFYILGAGDAPLPIGQTGELHIGGAGVARGYVRRPELTAQKFVPNPFGAGRMYRTGDAARMLPTGEVQLFGRLDDQVKLRGFRIELGEIQAVLMRQANLAAAVVLLRADPNTEPQLVAYYVERPEWPQTAEALRAVLTTELPEYMIPASWVRLDAMPISPNGKLDRAALPAPERAATPAADIRLPQTPTESALVEIWIETLQLPNVSTTADIFDLGADSIHIFRITARANKRGLAFPAKQLIRLRTIAALAQYLDAQNAPLLAPASN
jgi:acyl-CoA synthetase (AMP-forming)/AMP-acid ligase II/aryl carrier-like protein